MGGSLVTRATSPAPLEHQTGVPRSGRSLATRTHHPPGHFFPGTASKAFLHHIFMKMAPNDSKSRGKVEEACRFYLENPRKFKIAEVATIFGVARSTLTSRIHGRGTLSQRPVTNTKLDIAQEAALCRYIDLLETHNLSLRKELVRGAADLLLRAAAPAEVNPAPTVGINWVSRFCKRHRFRVIPQKILEAERQISEDAEDIRRWFCKLRDTMEGWGIRPKDLWNMDETGFQIRVGKDQMALTRRKRATYLGMPTNRESATAIEAISAAGRYLPAFLILTGKCHMRRWYLQEELHDETAIAVSAIAHL